MSIRIILAALIALVLTARGVTQDRATFERLPLRVISVTPGAGVVVDRGGSDLLEEGDRVLFTRRGGSTHWGTVRRVDERSAVVQLDDATAPVEPGTRGEAMVPRIRMEPPPAPPATDQPSGPDPADPPPPADDLEPQGPPAHPAWQRQDDDWRRGEALLAKVRPVRPAERPTTFSGRIWMLGDYVGVPSNDDNSANSRFRAGTEVRLDNPFGAGGGLRFDGEIYHRTEWDQDERTRLLVRGLSYGNGGTRFNSSRWEVGRFLQFGMPEFGFLDGFEWGGRTSSGNRYGASVGFLPEVSADFETGRDLQFAGYYHWAQDDRELLTFTVGYQKTFNDGDADRDLMIVKARALDLDGWDLLASTWIDFYFGNDDIKSSAVGLTYALVSLSRNLGDHGGMEIAYRHQEYPDLLRDEDLPVTPEQIADDRVDRAWVEGWGFVGESTRLRGLLGIWNDESDTGGSAQAGIGFLDAFIENGDLELTLFGSAGSFETLAGGRAVYGRNTDLGRWDLLYELSLHRFEDRPDDGDDLLQHRFRASHAFYTDSGWTWSFHGDAVLWDEEVSWGAGFHVQKVF